MLAALTSAVHLPISARMSLSNWAGVLPTASSPWLVNMSMMAGCAVILTSSRLSLSTIARGVFAGATIPCQFSTANPGTPAYKLVDYRDLPRAERLRLGRAFLDWRTKALASFAQTFARASRDQVWPQNGQIEVASGNSAAQSGQIL